VDKKFDKMVEAALVLSGGSPGTKNRPASRPALPGILIQRHRRGARGSRAVGTGGRPSAWPGARVAKVQSTPASSLLSAEKTAWWPAGARGGVEVSPGLAPAFRAGRSQRGGRHVEWQEASLV